MDVPSQDQFDRAVTALTAIDYRTLRAVLAARGLTGNAAVRRADVARSHAGTMRDRIAFFSGSRGGLLPAGPFAPYAPELPARKERVYLGASISGRNMKCKRPSTPGPGSAASSGGMK